MESKFKPHFELQVGPVLGTDERERNDKPRFAPDLKPEDYAAIVEMRRRVADLIDEEHTPVRRDPGRSPEA